MCLLQVLMTARLALAMGCPIHAIIAHASTATDQAGRSVPAPGQGVLTSAREVRPYGEPLSRLLDPAYRRRRLQRELDAADAWAHEEEAEVAAEAAAAAVVNFGSATTALAAAQRIAAVQHERAHMERAARRAWCVDFAAGAGAGAVAPLRAALAAWGLGPDDITLGSFHGAH
jgi:fatty acid synthase subunit alpha